MGKLSGKVALITGGGSGIGREIALLFAREGADIAVCGRRCVPLDEVVAEVGALGRRGLAVSGDIGKEEDVVRIVAKTAEVLGGPHILVNNASLVGQVAPVEKLDRSEWDEVMAVNLTGTMLMCRESVPHMRTAGGGAVVNVSSNVGRRGFPNRAPYVCSKWAMHGLTQTLARETAADGIRVNAICPGPVLTERLEGSMRKMADARGISVTEVQKEWESESPMGRFATVEECARVSLFLACDDSSGMTGQALNVTAGVIMT